MKLSGEEKRIQALFHELNSEDDLVAPSFARTWNIAQARFARANSSRAVLNAFPKLPHLITAIVIIAFVVAVAVLWSQQPRSNRQLQESLANQLSNDPGHTLNPPAERASDGGSSRMTKPEKPNRSPAGPRRLRRAERALAASRSPRMKHSQLLRWQSPTTGLLRFPGDELLRSAPAVIQSAPELRTFLSHMN
jgi:hypothetical protein